MFTLSFSLDDTENVRAITTLVEIWLKGDNDEKYDPWLKDFQTTLLLFADKLNSTLIREPGDIFHISEEANLEWLSVAREFERIATTIKEAAELHVADAMRPTLDQFKEWRGEARADFDGMDDHRPNLRTAHCRVCGVKLPPGAGIRYHELMTDFYRGSDRFVCSVCESASA